MRLIQTAGRVRSPHACVFGTCAVFGDSFIGFPIYFNWLRNTNTARIAGGNLDDAIRKLKQGWKGDPVIAMKRFTRWLHGEIPKSL